MFFLFTVELQATAIRAVLVNSSGHACRRRVHLALYLGDLARTPCNFQIKEILEVQPKLGIRVEVACQAQRSLRRDSAPLVYYFADASRRHVQFECKPVDCQAERLHKVLPEDFTRMHRRY